MENIKVVKSKRRTYSIEINKDSSITVRVPIWATKSQINAVLKEKHNWIQKKLNDVIIKNNNIRKKQFINGEEFDCLGEKYILTIVDTDEFSLRSHGKNIYLSQQDIEFASTLFEQWYRNKAKVYISNRAMEISEHLNIPFNKVKINNARTRWGSCSAKKNLNFSWRLVIGPKVIVDYVIVHEISHLIEMNHSKKFWSIVASILPSYKKYEKWLKENGSSLDI